MTDYRRPLEIGQQSEAAIADEIESKIERASPEVQEAIRKALEEFRDHTRTLDDELILAEKLASGKTDRVPLAALARYAGQMAAIAEPRDGRRGLAYYEAAREFVRTAKRAIRAGALTGRDQGVGTPLHPSTWRWCTEDETLRTISEFMPHERVMVRADEARKWWLAEIGPDLPPLLRLDPNAKAEGAAAAPKVKQPQEEEKRNAALCAFVDQKGGLKTRGVGKAAAEKFGLSQQRVRQLVASRDKKAGS